jgi:hypothetical protein
MEVSLYEREIEMKQRRKETLRDARNWRLGRIAQGTRDGQQLWSAMRRSWLVERAQTATRAVWAGLARTWKPEEECC